MLLLFALIVGSVSSAWGQSDYSAVYTSNCTISGSYASTIVIDSKNYSGQKAGTGSAGGSISVTVPKDTKYLHLHMSGWSGETPSVSISSSPTVTGLTSSISVTANSGFSGNGPTYNFSGDPSSSNYYKVITFTSPLASETTITFSTSSGKKRFVIWGVNAEILPSSVTIKNGDNVVSDLNMTVGEDDVTLSATVAPAAASQTVTWTSSDNSVATVSNGTVHAVAPGEATITATSSLNTVYATCDVTVISGSTLGSVTFSPVTGEYYYGEPITISAPNNEHIYYTVNGDEPTTSSPEYTTPLTLTQTMTLKALAVKGSDEQTGSIDYTLKAPEAPTFDVAAGAVAENTPLTITAGEGGSIIKYTIDGTDPNVSSETYSAPIVIDNALTIKAVTMDAGNNLSSVTSASYTLTLPEGSKRYVLMSSTDQLTDGGKIIIVNDDEDYVLSTNQRSSNREAISISTIVNDEVSESSLPTGTQIVELESVAESSYWYLKVGENSYLYASSNSSNSMGTGTKTNADNTGGQGQASITITNTGVHRIVFHRTQGRNTMQYNHNNGNPDIFSCYASANQTDIKVYVQESEPATINANVSAAGWATYATKYPMTFEDGDAYVIVSADNGTGTTTMSKVTSVPANTAVLLKGTAGEATVKTATIISGDAPSAPATNYLHIVEAGETINASSNVYVLANKTEGVGFYPWTGTALARGKVYMQLPAGAKLNGFYAFGEETGSETDGISSVSTRSVKQGEFYNLAGQRVSNPTKGLYIINGKKVIIK